MKYEGLGVGQYHIDSLEGLKFFIEALNNLKNANIAI